MGITGDWDVRIKTPVGSLRVDYHFADENDVLAGHACGSSETVPLRDIEVSDDAGVQRVRWRQTVTKPMRLHLEFDVEVSGDRLTGHSRAGRLPRSAVTGVRRTPEQKETE
ncbi:MULTISPECIES: hypothetical protein [Mycobacteriaceae]|uniref:hypothetical protein n=1 Tax=Mycobacteriaceae TaxID=1762 RepID=UPI0007FFE5EB|nr:MULTISPECIES: hypothetical protein [Mycobacteriaceae]MCK0173012.1 hypothetical protein [Mycolicibacterium sp. F2034L]OBB57922.1 hypothetical protein A5757_19055 [Mycobacterium sp. 852013-51886_SCH5428379]